MGRFLATIVMLTSSACCAMAQEPGLQSEKGKALTITLPCARRAMPSVRPIAAPIRMHPRFEN